MKTQNISISEHNAIKNIIEQIIRQYPDQLVVDIAKEALFNRDIASFLHDMYHYKFDWNSRTPPSLPYFQNPDKFYEKYYHEINSKVEFANEMGAFITEIEKFKPTGEKNEINIEVWIGFETAIQMIIAELEKVLGIEFVHSKIL